MSTAYKKNMKPIIKQASIVLAHSDLTGQLLDCSAALPEAGKSPLLIADYLSLPIENFADFLAELEAAGGSLEMLVGCSPHCAHEGVARKVAVFCEPSRLTWVISPQDNCQISRTELANERDKLRMILDYAPIGIWLQNGAGKLEFVNQAFCMGMGISEEKFLSVEHYQEVIPEEFRPVCLASDAKALASESPTVTFQQLPFSDGLVHDLQVIKAVNRNDDGSPRSLVGLALDITDRLKQEAALREVHQQLRQQELSEERRRLQERRHIAQALHDDLGQFLTAISLGLDTLGKSFPGDNPISGYIKNLSELVGEAIQTTREVTASLRPPLALEQGLQFAVEKLVARLRDSTPIIITTEIDKLLVPRTPQYEQITLAIYRLIQEGLTNALRHSAAKTIQINAWSEDGAIKAKLSDDGKGFPTNDLKYSRGLGLLGVRERAEMLGGNFSIESTPGEGTRLLLTIPNPIRGESKK
jgi:PAS domain S-box-containing protein